MNPRPIPIPDEEYVALPECIRRLYTEHEYRWMTAGQKARLMDSELEPEYTE
jgi:hypothetical protein